MNTIPALVQIMAWHQSGDKPLSEPKMVSLLTDICFSRPQWVTTCRTSTLSCLTMLNLWILLVMLPTVTMVTIGIAHKDDTNSNILYHDTLSVPLPANLQYLLGIHFSLPVMRFLLKPETNLTRISSVLSHCNTVIQNTLKRLYFVS